MARVEDDPLFRKDVKIPEGFAVTEKLGARYPRTSCRRRPRSFAGTPAGPPEFLGGHPAHPPVVLTVGSDLVPRSRFPDERRVPLRDPSEDEEGRMDSAAASISRTRTVFSRIRAGYSGQESLGMRLSKAETWK